MRFQPKENRKSELTQVTFDINEYNAHTINESEVETLVGSMYSTVRANPIIVEFFKKTNLSIVVPYIEKMICNNDEGIRCTAVELLSILTGDKSVDHIDSLLIDPEETVRFAGCSILSNLSQPESQKRLVNLLSTDPSENVRYLAADMLGTMGDISVTPTLHAAIESDTGTDFEGRTIKDKCIESLLTINERLR